MCGRYYIDEGLWDEDLGHLLQQAVRVSAKLCADMKTAGEIRPTDIAPVIAPNALNRAMGAFPMQWGFAHPTRGMLVFNTRMETAPEKDLFASSVNDRRCLIPASGYFEWKRADKNKKERFAFRAADEGPLLLHRPDPGRPQGPEGHPSPHAGDRAPKTGGGVALPGHGFP